MKGRVQQPRRPLQTKVLVMIVGLFLVLAIPPWFIVAAIVQFSPNIELKSRQAMERHGAADWEHVASLGDRMWRDPSPATFAGLNSGQWTQLCVNGGFTDPVETFETVFGPSDIAGETRQLYDRLTPVGEYDLAVSYSDGAGKVEILYVVAGGSLQAIHLVKCMRQEG